MSGRAYCLRHIWLFFFLVFGSIVHGQTCYAPERPFVPSDSRDVQEYRDLIGKDFEDYISDIQGYFLCLEEERGRAFEEARDVSNEYGRFLEIVNN